MDLPWSPIKVTIAHLETVDNAWSSKPYIDYRVRFKMNNITWNVAKRYNQIQDFHKFILASKLVDPKVLPPFPDAPIFDMRQVRNQILDVAKERQPQLETYLEYVVNLQPIFDRIETKVFCEIGNALPKRLNRRVLIPLPDTDFDVTQVAVIWKVLMALGVTVEFSTETGSPAVCSELQMRKGKSMIYGVSPDAKRYYKELEKDQQFASPIPWEDIDPAKYSGLVIVGGQAPHYTHYLESALLAARLSKFWALRRPIGAIAQGPLLLSRAKFSSGNSILYNTKTTGLPKYIEEASFYIDALAFWKEGTHQILDVKSCEENLIQNLAGAALFEPGPKTVIMDDLYTESSAFTLTDSQYISARWAGDAYTFAKRFAALVISSEYAFEASFEDLDNQHVIRDEAQLLAGDSLL